MSATIIDGSAIAKQHRDKTKQAIARHCHAGHPAPGLAVIIIGENPASMIYVNHKHRACEEVGIISTTIALDTDISEVDLLGTIDELNNDPTVNGILVQLPLPDHINPDHVIDAIDPEKDVDGFHPYNIGRLAIRRPLLRPCTPKGVMTLLHTIKPDLKGMNAAIVGASNIVGRPMGLELLMCGCSVTVLHRFSKDLTPHTQNADILISAIGKPNFIDASWIKPGAIVIDIGITRRDDGKLAGDVNFNDALAVAGFITPVPGGVGPMTVASLLENTLDAAIKQVAHNTINAS